jgi:hypothetical protein
MENKMDTKQLEQLKAELQKLQALEPGTDPATPESLARIAEQIKKAETEIDGIAPEYLGGPEHKIALECLHGLKAEWNAQDRKLAADRMLTELLQSVIRVREILNEGQKLIDNTSIFEDRIARKFFAFYADNLTPALNRCLDTTLGEFINVGIV